MIYASGNLKLIVINNSIFKPHIFQCKIIEHNIKSMYSNHINQILKLFFLKSHNEILSLSAFNTN